MSKSLACCSRFQMRDRNYIGNDINRRGRVFREYLSAKLAWCPNCVDLVKCPLPIFGYMPHLPHPKPSREVSGVDQGFLFLEQQSGPSVRIQVNKNGVRLSHKTTNITRGCDASMCVKRPLNRM